MGSQLLAESLGRDSRFEILGVAAAADIFPIAAREPDVSLISMEFDAGAKKGLQVARALNAVHPGIHIVILLEESTRESVIASFRCGATGVFCRTGCTTAERSTSSVERSGLGATRLSTCLRRSVTRRPATAWRTVSSAG